MLSAFCGITLSRIVHDYVIWRLVMDLMPHMPPQYEATRAEFRRVLLGVLTDRNRWNRCVEWTNKKLGMAVGALFIRDNFNHDSKVIIVTDGGEEMDDSKKKLLHRKLHWK